MYKKIVGALYVLNILFQSLYTLALPIGVGALISFLLTKYASAPQWIWVVFILLGVFVGIYTMIKFVISASESYKRIERDNLAREKNKKEKEETKEREEVDGIGTE